MRKRDKVFILKYFLNIFNGIFLALGLTLVGFGLWISIENNTFFILLLSTGEHSLIAPVSHMLLVTGSIIVFIGLLGYLGSLQEIRCLVVMYISLLILVLIIQVAMLLLLYTGKNTTDNLWKAQMDELISNYGNKNLPEKEHQWDILNVIQHTLQCCGRHNITDWKWNEHKEHAGQVPCSCTTSIAKKWFCEAVKNGTYMKGCEEDIRMWYEENTWLLISINAGLLSVEILQFIVAAWLFRSMRKNEILPTI